MPCATAERTTARSRSELIAMMSGAGRTPPSADATSMPLASGSPMSSSTRSIGDAVAAAVATHAHRAVTGADGAVHHETRHPLGVLAVRLGDQRFVLDDQHPDHERAATGAGMVAVITEP